MVPIMNLLKKHYSLTIYRLSIAHWSIRARQGAQNHIQGAAAEMFQVVIVGRRCDFDTGIRTIDTEFEYGFKCIERMCGSVQQKTRAGLCFLQPFSPAPFLTLFLKKGSTGNRVGNFCITASITL